MRVGQSVKPVSVKKRFSSLGTKLNLILGIFFILFWVVLSALYFEHEKQDILAQAESHCEEILTQIDAVQSYMREVMSPQMFNLSSEEEFIPECIVSTYVSPHVMEIYLAVYPEYYFKFATDNPSNELNLADQKELEIIGMFHDDPNLERWEGVIERNGETHLAVATPIRYVDSCSRCHSRPDIAPATLVESCRDTAGFKRDAMDIAIKSVSIPIDAPLNSAKTAAFRYGLLAAIGLTGLFLFSYLLLRRLITSPVKRLREGAERLGSGELDIRLDWKSGDEIEDFAHSFNRMAEKIQESHSTLEHRVSERTEELKTKVAELEEFNREMVGREMRMIELKMEINSLLVANGKAPKYTVSDENDEPDDRIGSENREIESQLVAAVADTASGDDKGQNDQESEGSGL